MLVKTDFELFKHPSKFKFKLQKLSLDDLAPSAVGRLNLFFFLKTQAQTLESLEISWQPSPGYLQLILNMPRLSWLKTQIFEVDEAISSGRVTLPVNTTITSLELNQTNCHPEPIPYQILLRALRNLKHFKSENITDELFTALARDAPGLESIETFRFSVTRLPEGDIFPNIKDFKVKGGFVENSPLPTGHNNFAVLARSSIISYRLLVANLSDSD